MAVENATTTREGTISGCAAYNVLEECKRVRSWLGAGLGQQAQMTRAAFEDGPATAARSLATDDDDA